MNDSGQDLSREELLGLLRETGEILASKRIEADLYIVGGAAMSLEFDARRITRDVDASLRARGDEFWKAAAEVADRHGLDRGWINKQAEIFFTNEPDDEASELSLPGLRIAIASPDHLIAMKLRAMRERDQDDLIVLFEHAGIRTPEEAAAIHDRLFDESYAGYFDPDESLYAAQTIFRRAERLGRPIGSLEDRVGDLRRPGSRTGLGRAKTTPKSNRGSFAPRLRGEGQDPMT